MKKHIAIAAGLAVLSGNAFATKARMSGLAQNENYGSLFLDDTRSVFLNPGKVNNFKDYAVTEWGTSGSTTNPNAEGGFFKSAGAFNYGLYLGSDFRNQNVIRSQSTVGGHAGTSIAMGHTGFVQGTNDVDLFFGGDMGIEWGARLHYVTGKNEPTGTGAAGAKREQSGLGLGLGIVMGDLDVYANMVLSDESKENGATSGAKWEGGGLQAGLAYGLAGYKFYADYDAMDAEYTSGATGVAKNETTKDELTVGVAKITSVSASSVFIWDIHYLGKTVEDKDGTTASNTTEIKTTALPITVGFETDATSWLTLRGGVVQRVVINSKETKVNGATTKASEANTTTVAAGGTLNFGKLKVDGTFEAVGTGKLNSTELFSKVAVHYWF